MARPKQNINIKMLAEEAGVSHMTVSRVINNRAGVSEAVRQKVKALQEKYKYQTTYKSLVHPKIAFIVPNNKLSDYHMRLLNGMMNYVGYHDLEVATIMNNNNSSNILNQLRDIQCSAVAFTDGTQFPTYMNELENLNLPILVLDHSLPGTKFGYIDNDSYVGSCEAAKYLIQQGHRNIGYIYHGERESGNHLQRIQGYKDTLQKAGIELKSQWMQAANILMKELDINYWDSVPYAVERLLENSPELTAIMTIDDNMAIRVSGKLQRMGYKIPDDISLVGFDNRTDSDLWHPRLTTVHHKLENAGSLAAEALHYAIKHPGKWKLPQTVLPTKLIVRDSTKNIKDN